MRLTYKAVFFFALAASLLAQQQPGQLKHDGNGALEAFYDQDANKPTTPTIATPGQNVKKSHKRLIIGLVIAGAAGAGIAFAMSGHGHSNQNNGTFTPNNNGITVLPGTFGGAH
jgi:hypothetical protein